MRWLVTGATGQLGHHLSRLLAGSDAICLTRADLDITRPDEVEAAIDAVRPDVVINAAAYTAVDAAESDEATALTINRDGPAHLAAALSAQRGRLIHISTDYVFDGTADRPYEPSDPTGPRTAYGRTKLAGEIALAEMLPERSIVVRTSWVYGGPGRNFVDTMCRLEQERPFVSVVGDQIGSPTYVSDLAAALIALGRSRAQNGTLHFSNAGQASWADLARETFRAVGADPHRVREVTTADFRTPAPRPRWSVLSTESWVAAGLPAPRGWQQALHDHLRNPNMTANAQQYPSGQGATPSMHDLFSSP